MQSSTEQRDITTEPTVEADLSVSLHGITAYFVVVPGATGHIVTERLLSETDMPPAFMEIQGLRANENEQAAGWVARRIIAKAVEILQAISCGLPFLWQCSKRHAAIWERVFAHRGLVTFLRGSRRPDNPYPPLVWVGDPDADDHIVRLDLQ